ncbi:MAG TPA: beta-L-arabinofuranosidase domain-containing protein [Opitutaceae bacterium]|nr:beta-L-arabinofuranosidase domain-containing protein [Opitutaceae bacterium]
MKRYPMLLVAAIVGGWSALPAARAGERGLIDTTRSPDAKMYMVDLADTRWTGGFWGERWQVCRDTMVPHLWEIFQNDQESHAWANFLIAAGYHRGDDKFHGPPFNDGDFLKWFESLAQVYAVTRDPAIDAQMDKIIAVIAKAQREDGYLHTQTIIPQRQGEKVKEFADREHFETYNMGHLMTAACIHYRATGKTTMLALAEKAADYIDRLCQRAPDELARNAICPSHYMGVVELYRTTHNPRYLALAKRLIEIRSLVPPDVGSDFNQDRVPFRELSDAEGHAVRANYLYAGVADVYAESGDRSLLGTLTKLADNVADTKLYITGMTGALYDGASPDGSADSKAIKLTHQSYGRDYQLPNLTAYNESCATVGYALWTWRMFEVTGNARYADLFEQTLYNGVLAGISLDGTRYFYTNALRKDHDFKWPLRWSRTRQPNIKQSFCCPPNIVRTIAEANNYVYSLSPGTVWVNLYADTSLDTHWLDGSRIKLRQETNYPWDGAIKLTVDEAPAHAVDLKLRIPGWSHPGATTLRVNGQPFAADLTPGTYADVRREWHAGDTIELNIAFAPTLWEANPLVEETLNQVAVRDGPIVYCLEANDLPSGVRLQDVVLSLTNDPARFAPHPEKIVNADLMALRVPALELMRPAWGPGTLYREATLTPPRPIQITMIPYFAWDNRGDTDMSVWLPVR